LQVFVIHRGKARIEVACIPVCLSPRPLKINDLTIKVRGTGLASVNGACKLVFVIAKKELLALPFEMVSEEKVVERIKVAAIEVEAQTKTGKRKSNPDPLQLSEHETISVTAKIEIGIPAPNATVECSVVLKLDEVIIGHADSALQLNHAWLVVKGGKMKLKSLVPRTNALSQKLAILVVIGGEEKGSHTVAVVSVSRMTNFEGQLTTDASRLEVDDEEYQAILNRL